MATFTITTPTYYDTLTGSVGDDTYNINGGSLIIDSDTRYCSNHTETTGNLGNVTISTTLGGDFIIDATKVRLIPFDSGSGNVPAYGTTISQDGVSGTLIGVYTDISAVPTTSGSQMPSSGFIKINRKQGTNFSVGGLSGIGANATGTDIVGWIEVVGVETRVLGTARLGNCIISGDWFSVGNTNGSSATTYQLPASKTNTFYPGVWVETSASSQNYEFYPNAGNVTTAAPMDERGKVCWIDANGVLRLGYSGTTSASGYLPTSGCHIRVPNIVTLNAAAATLTANNIPNASLSTRYEFGTGNSGNVIINKANLTWFCNFAQPYSIILQDSGISDYIFISKPATPINIDNIGVGCTQAQSQTSLQLDSCFSGGVIQNSKFTRYALAGSSQFVMFFRNITGITFKNNIIRTVTNRTNGNTGTWNIANATNCNFFDNTNIGARQVYVTCFGCLTSGTKYADSFYGIYSTANSQYAEEYNTKCSYCTISNISMLVQETRNEPYSGLIQFANCDNMTIRNIGTSAEPIDFAGVTQHALLLNQNNTNVKMQRVYVKNTRVRFFSYIDNSDNGLILENCAGDYLDATAPQTQNAQYKGIIANIQNIARTSVFGSHFFDNFTGTTSGKITLMFNEKTDMNPSKDVYTILSGAPRFTALGSLFMSNVGDSIEFTMPYYALGHTAFNNSAPTLNDATIGNYEILYMIDTGTGFGEYKTLTQANLVSESINPNVGVKLKIKITTTTANTGAMTSLVLNTNTTAEAQYIQYPLETVYPTLSIVDIKPNSEIRIYSSQTRQELAGVENSTSVFDYNYTWTGTDVSVDIVIFNVQYQPVYFYNYMLTNEDSSIPVQQIFDRNYLNS
jgi:hypothetical protein